MTARWDIIFGLALLLCRAEAIADSNSATFNSAIFHVSATVVEPCDEVRLDTTGALPGQAALIVDCAASKPRSVAFETLRASKRGRRLDISPGRTVGDIMLVGGGVGAEQTYVATGSSSEVTTLSPEHDDLLIVTVSF